MQRKRTCPILLAILLMALLLCACSSEQTVTSGSLLLNGKNVAVDAVLTIQDHPISADAYRYQFMTLKAEMQSEEETETWDEETQAAFKVRVAEYLALMVAVEETAEQYGISRGEESAAYAAEQLATVRAEYPDDDEFNAILKASFMTESQLLYLLETDYIQYNLYEAMFGESGRYALTDDQLLSVVNHDYVRVRYIKIAFTEENEAEKKSYAEQILQEVRGGLDFTEAVNTYTEESGMQGNPDGLYFSHGMTKDSVFEDACYALNVDEVSGVIRGDGAFYLIKRLPIETEYVTDNAETLLDAYYETIFSEQLLALAKTYTIQYCDIYDSISVQSMG